MLYAPTISFSQVAVINQHTYSLQQRIYCEFRPDKATKHILQSTHVRLLYFTLGSILYLRKLHNEELSDLYSLPNIVRVAKSRRMRWEGHVARMGEGRGMHRVLVVKPEGKRPLGRHRRRWEDNINMDLQEVEVVGTGWSWLSIGTGGGHL